MRNLRVLIILGLTLGLYACASGGSAIVQTLQNIWADTPDVSKGSLNPNFRYLRVVVDGRISLLVLGYTDSHPRGPIEVWYSAERQVIRLQNGRLIGASGTTTEWNSVSLPILPAWSAIATLKAPVRWVRSRDVMPGYRFGIKDELITRAVPPPRQNNLTGIDPRELIWFEEKYDLPATSTSYTSRNASEPLPVAKYAVALSNGPGTVIYAEQCLSKSLCFSWQRWPAIGAADIKK